MLFKLRGWINFGLEYSKVLKDSFEQKVDFVYKRMESLENG